MSLPLLVSLIYRESSGMAFLAVAAACAAAGFMLVRKKPKDRTIYSREGIVTVALSWILLSILGALPFVISGEIPHVVDALFESISGFTTTGASILSDVEAMSRTSLFWRCFTNWIGGMGVLVFILAVLPAKENGTNMHIMRAESPGPSVGKLVPRVRTTAIILYSIYFSLTIAEIIFLFIAGVPLYDAFTLTFATAGTGGFGIWSNSIAGYSAPVQYIIAIFLVLFGISFNAYFLILRRKIKQAVKSTEVLVYLGIIAASTIAITISIMPLFSSAAESVRHSFFQVSSIMTTAGFATADFNAWPVIAKTILVILMFIGACSGSTGGGIKVSRLIILLKGIKREIEIVCHPRSVKRVKMDGRLIENDVVRSVNSYIAIYVIIFAASLLIVSLNGFDLVTNFTAVTTTINNVGPGLELVGPSSSFLHFSDLSKIVLMFNMLAGRLELLPLLMLFVPATWRR